MVRNWHTDEVQEDIRVLFHKKKQHLRLNKSFPSSCFICGAFTSGNGAQQVEDFVPTTKYYLKIKILSATWNFPKAHLKRMIYFCDNIVSYKNCQTILVK